MTMRGSFARGAIVIEYGLIAVVISAGVTSLVKNVGTTFNKVAGSIGGTAS